MPGTDAPPQGRPAETAGLAGAVAVLLGYFLGITDPAVLAALAVVVGAVPAAVTALVVLRRRKKSGQL
jgi:hypothetical protein